MTRPLLVCILLLTTSNSFGQTDPKESNGTVWGTSIGVSGSEGSGSLNTYIYATLDKDRHFFALGPTFGEKMNLSYQYGYAEEGIYGITGAHLVYHITMNPINKVFEYYFQFHFDFHYFSDSGINTGYPSGEMINQQYQSHRTDLEYFFGCGYNLKFLKKMYFTQSIGIGFIHEYTKIQYENLPKYNVDESFNRASILLSAGLGYKF